MPLDELIPFLGGALLVATLGTLLAAGLLRLVRPQARIGRIAAALFAVLTFVTMTQHPLPDRATMVCPMPGAAPQLHPFAWTARSPG